ncbi:RING finger family 4 domain-containing protein [Streptomyces sp. UP1A-1]|nr:RING finger family 4 domain-containing protein [Streptomyces sp. UP1A-1]
MCWDGSDYAGCPLCHRRIDGDDPFLRPVRAVGAARATVPGPLRLLRLGTDMTADATTAVDALLARRTPLSPQDRDDLLTLLPLTPAGRGDLPQDIPVRETKALVLGALVRRAPSRPSPAEAARRAAHHRHRRAEAALRALGRRRRAGDTGTVHERSPFPAA